MKVRLLKRLRQQAYKEFKIVFEYGRFYIKYKTNKYVTSDIKTTLFSGTYRDPYSTTNIEEAKALLNKVRNHMISEFYLLKYRADRKNKRLKRYNAELAKL
jgi:hypothetical protein